MAHDLHFKIGTRGSDLAMWQAHHVRDLLEARGASVEIVVMKTRGDRIRVRARARAGPRPAVVRGGKLEQRHGLLEDEQRAPRHRGDGDGGNHRTRDEMRDG